MVDRADELRLDTLAPVALEPVALEPGKAALYNQDMLVGKDQFPRTDVSRWARTSFRERSYQGFAVYHNAGKRYGLISFSSSNNNRWQSAKRNLQCHRTLKRRTIMTFTYS